ncbi:MAG: alanine--glyoxylate aminotransferase family protein [Actinomycetota bacterium]|jgi:aspartate aminotransferase-like enzyme|nr:alanine--glyoxylate aminotransferase family protein [Actinomycetota bacterium]
MPEMRYRLMTPGPTPVPAEVLAAMSAPIVHHRTPAFRATLARLLARLKEVYRTDDEILLFTSSGTGGMESAVANLCSPGDRVLVASAGNFGERWAAIAKAYGCDLVHLRYSWGETPTADDVASTLAERGGATAVLLTHCETSTGVVSDIRAIAERVGESTALTVVDAISSLGAVPLETDAWGLDVVVAGSQKALMTPPGLATVAASEGALEAARTNASPRFYLDWGRTFDAQNEDPPVNPFTPAISLVLGLDVAVSLLLDEGLEAVFDRHIRLGRACRAGAKAMGLELFSPDEDRSAVVTAIRMPPEIDAGEVIATIGERHGITLEGGRAELVGKIVRIGHIGYMDVFDVATALAALELVLGDLGADIERGVAVTAALDAYAEPVRV